MYLHSGILYVVPWKFNLKPGLGCGKLTAYSAYTAIGSQFASKKCYERNKLSTLSLRKKATRPTMRPHAWSYCITTWLTRFLPALIFTKVWQAWPTNGQTDRPSHREARMYLEGLVSFHSFGACINFPCFDENVTDGRTGPSYKDSRTNLKTWLFE